MKSKITATLLPGLVLLSHSCSNDQNNQITTERPNVLFIMIDDLRDWTSYSNGFSNVQTPNLDQLARQGTVFSNAHCAAPVCSPSRTALLTGISPANTGIYTNGQQWPDDIRTHETLTRKYMNEGYYVAGYGKIYHGEGDLQYWHHYSYGEYSPAPKNPENPLALGNRLHIPDSLTGDGKRVNNAINILEKDINSPLFLACGLVRPHTPWDVPAKYFDMYPLDSIQLPEVKDDDLADIPYIGKKMAMRPMVDHYNGNNNSWSHQAIKDSNLWKINIQAYLASITFADAQLGHLLERWYQSKYSKNGIVVVVGDHGWHHGEKDHWSKRTLWDVGTRTPMIVHAPGYSKPGDICDIPVSLLDIYPTLLDLCKMESTFQPDGLSLAPLLANNNLPWDKPAVTIYGRDNVSVKTQKWRYIHYCDGTKELYNHEEDPEEYTNLANDPAMMSIINSLHRWVPKCRDFATYSRERNHWFLKEDLICGGDTD